MTTMPMLHPSIPPGPFDLAGLLEYEPPVRWHPEPGEKVIGHLVKSEMRVSFGTGARHLWLLVPPEAFDEHDHLYTVVRCSGVVLSGAVQELAPVPGEKVAVKYDGLRPTADGTREYKYFQLAVHRRGRWQVAR